MWLMAVRIETQKVVSSNGQKYNIGINLDNF
jgi:hypothetical protein